ncbi:hypothetical protein F4827_003880 [Paraburkholderia bannensis]|uniref:Uncharacterized protein n=2 Tax=Paraburkholderia bannensis TaxID=765414 RepID=A0A7W9WU63_9BURK|nr:hypothetical protein [Paraburkholderia bannensis]
MPFIWSPNCLSRHAAQHPEGHAPCSLHRLGKQPSSIRVFLDNDVPATHFEAEMSARLNPFPSPSLRRFHSLTGLLLASTRQALQPSLRRPPVATRCTVALAAGVALALAACAPATPTQSQSLEPEVANLSPLASQLFTGHNQAGAYYSLDAKATFAIDAPGKLRLLDVRSGEPVAGPADMQGETMSTACKPFGAVANQRTTWFPYTGVFVRGGTLAAVSSRGGNIGIKSLSARNDGAMIYTGHDADKIEFFYAPCVGAQRVTRGWRTQRYIPDGTVLRVRADTGMRVDLQLPQRFVPYVLLRYRSGAIIPVPMRVVLATVDLSSRRVVLQYQSTFAAAAPIRKIEMRLITPGGLPSSGETAARYQERTQALMDDLAACPPPQAHAIETCATPTRMPNPLIYYSSAELASQRKTAAAKISP